MNFSFVNNLFSVNVRLFISSIMESYRCLLSYYSYSIDLNSLIEGFTNRYK